MDIASSNDDDEPKICTVFSSTANTSKTIFDTIAFTNPKKEDKPFLPIPATSPVPFSAPAEPEPVQSPFLPASQLFGGSSDSSSNVIPSSAKADFDSLISTPLPATITSPLNQSPRRDFQTVPVLNDGSGDDSRRNEDPFGISQGLDKTKPVVSESLLKDQTADVPGVTDELSSLTLDVNIKSNSTADELLISAPEDSPLPTANVLFADTPEVPFPIGTGAFQVPSVDTTSKIATDFDLNRKPFPPVMSEIPVEVPGPGTPSPSVYSFPSAFSSTDAAYEAWVPSEETRKILFALTTAAQGANYIPDKAKLTMPGIVHDEDMVDKVAINMARIFGEAEASRRKILTADIVTQDDNGLRELIKLGCYRSAINLTKRLLTLYGQGPGKIGHFSKHTPHSLQLWYTRISLLVRIREFTIADSEIEAFKDFENPDLYYEYYPELHAAGRRGSMVPFHFRLLAAEIPQYMRKTNDTFDQLTHILSIVEEILSNVSQGYCEDGNPIKTDEKRKELSLLVWSKRELRVLYSLANAAIFTKDFNGAVLYLHKLLLKDKEHEMQLKSSLGRLFLQFGDISSAERYFTLAAESSNKDSETDRVETLVDTGLLAIGQNNYAKAFDVFKEALEIQPENYMLTNNMAVCLVYLGKVKDALALMETTGKQNTPQLLQENVILNLSTIYELENSDGTKKNSLLKLISEYKGDGINLASLKMPNLV